MVTLMPDWQCGARTEKTKSKVSSQLSNSPIYKIVWLCGVPYCEFRKSDAEVFRVKASVVLDMIERMVNPQ